MSLFRDLTGETFGHWTVVKRTEPPEGKEPSIAYWLVRCVCGREKVLKTHYLIAGESRSCGCVTRRIPHRYTRTNPREYSIWACMLTRCRRDRRYIAKGIKVCERWAKSFVDFFADMGPCPTPTHSIDRIDNAKGYYPENCRWATHREQLLNTERTRMLTFRGETKSIVEWAEQFGLKFKTVKCRIDRYGWTVERALTEAARPWGRSSA